ncbi:uncharacterized protein N7483_008187 [Penicillium malachiteum]|uniref:uncharacterized protein n=1 Tax=Penicillium malachiteum TaxID=1324776 RepID=UPI002546C80C|nr:uncharacterized protein N7483_008187 [Penicillium malachiteum]KAJ5720253.1 hypothetical protein N7483_008187 [Penicillium malachiteum]
MAVRWTRIILKPVLQTLTKLVTKYKVVVYNMSERQYHCFGDGKLTTSSDKNINDPPWLRDSKPIKIFPSCSDKTAMINGRKQIAVARCYLRKM